MKTVLDASAILAVLLREPGQNRVIEVLQDAVIGSVNFSETVAKLVDKGRSNEQAMRDVSGFAPFVTGFDADLAFRAGVLRPATKALGLSLGDRACLALAQREKAHVLTADRAWRGLEVGVEIEVIR